MSFNSFDLRRRLEDLAEAGYDSSEVVLRFAEVDYSLDQINIHIKNDKANVVLTGSKK